jgi:Phospholipase_D-nuclease N-terminal
MGIIKFALGAVWFLLTVGVLFRVWRADSYTGTSKVLWTLGVFMAPILGPVVWLLFGKRN